MTGTGTRVGRLRPLDLHAGRGLSLVRGEGARLHDSAGRTYIDLMSNYGVNVLGHAHPDVTAAIADQAARLGNVHQSFESPVRDAFLDSLSGVLPPQLSRVCFASTGAEAVEVAIKLARASTGRTRLVAMDGGYHGRTFGALSLTSGTAYRDPFMPLLPEVLHVPYDDVAALTAVLDDRVAAVVVEPIQGESGVRPCGPGYLRDVAAACRRNGTLLVVDEVQTGFRTGRVLASAWDGVVPDIVCLGKGIANGLPLAVTVCGEAVGERMPRGGHGSTYAGSPLVCAAGAATLRLLADPALHRHVGELGEAIVARLGDAALPMVREVRGRGLMVGIELRRPAGSYIRALQERGVLVLGAGRNVVRLLPPLVIDADLAATAIGHVVEVLGESPALQSLG